ncbi:LCP family protein [Candidatus Daviesbacteria bacterium]|nr:LCP family protein [Candidatus Daviesbacteria bacterium]
MKKLDFNLSRQNPNQKFIRVNKILKRLVPITFVLAVLIGLAIFLTTSSSTSKVVNFILSLPNLKSTNNRVNILLLGISGGTHAGSNLTDTIIVTTYNLKNNKLHLISIPRDLWLPSLQSKANAVYQMKEPQGGGLPLTKTVMGNIVGLPIHYGLRVDFRGFIKAVDILGGLDIEVERSFDDYNYPIEGKENDMCGNTEEEREFNEEEAKQLNIEPGKRKVLILTDGIIATDSAEEDKGFKYFTCRFEHISFKKGVTHMGGEEALKFVRSRRGTNGEGSDFARSKRQQKILEAIRNKALSLETLFNPAKIAELIKTLGKSLDTDISPTAALEFYKLSKKLETTQNIVLDDSKRDNLPDGRTQLLIHPPVTDYGGAYVLISQDDDFSFIQQYIRMVLNEEIGEATTSARSSHR